MAGGRLGSFFPFSYFRSVFQGGQREIEIGAHTIRSHGAAVARNHMHDWMILVILVVIEVILFVIHPFYRFVGKDMMDDLKYPLKDNTVPVWAVPVSSTPFVSQGIVQFSLPNFHALHVLVTMYAVLLPIVVFLLIYLRRRDVYDLHHAVLGLLFAVLITGVITDSIKNAVGRPRPDFFWRCFPDGVEVYDRWGDAICHGKDSDIKEGHKSFPSGHTSWSFAGLGFLSLYLSGKIQAFDRRGHVAKLCIVFLPLLVASLVGISRVDDYWHHWQDVFAGGILGLVVATFCYCQFFPPPYHEQGWGPYAYFKALEELRGNSNGAGPANVQYHQNPTRGPNGETFTAAFAVDQDSNATFDELESGRR
ncbi:hypothetical protein TIFTF001_007878 [Ficus carica]|uniref:Phosphatidic acid phosphatase type 2/haloperoxidase domain-containing protein n=1 Tax=Ficus carica TaxID=3494 RepID=A0AA87ZR80_FICCA|nr:hypothetical protein TIFTF001_007878 [Ficus carica]